MRNDGRLALLALLLSTSTLSARAEVGSWFAASVCEAGADAGFSAPGTRALFAVHHAPGVPAREALLLLGADGLWRAPLADWQHWTPQAAPRLETAPDGAQWVPLEPSGALALRIDACTAELWVDADPDRVQARALAAVSTAPVASAGRGGFVNLDAQYGGLAGAGAYNGLIDAGVFSAAGTGRSGFFFNRKRLLRLDTRWLVDDPVGARRLVLGDSITRSADWESAARFGGLQWGADYSLQPDRITFPLPSIAGSAALPSTAELYVNGQRQAGQALEPGNFRFESVPTLTGAGELAVVVRDALGREQTVRQSFYTSPRLLAAGLSENTLEAGLLRSHFATAQDRYRQAFVGTTLRQGLSPALTGVLRLAASAARSQLGGELHWVADTLGVLTVSAAASHTEAGLGGIATLGFEHLAPRWAFTLRRRMASPAYGDLGRAPGLLRLSDTARASVNLRRAGSASLLYVAEQPWQGRGVRLAGFTYSVGFGPRLQTYASALHAVSGVGGSNLVVGLSAALGSGTSAGIQASRNGATHGASASLQHAPEGRLGWAYGTAVDGHERGIRQAGAAVSTERGTFGAGIAGFGNRAAASALLQTGVVLLDGHGYWTRPVQQSFAAVETGGIAGVRVYRENQLVGRTGAGGRLLVPDLLPFTANQLSMADQDLPLTLGLASSALLAVPPANAGMTLRFAIQAEPGLPLRLSDAGGAAVPAGAALRLNGQPLPLPVGYDGLVYAELSEGSHQLQADWPGGHCQSRIEVAQRQVLASPCVEPAS